jgi:hypothetical protein
MGGEAGFLAGADESRFLDSLGMTKKFGMTKKYGNAKR